MTDPSGIRENYLALGIQSGLVVFPVALVISHYLYTMCLSCTVLKILALKILGSLG